MRSPDPRLAAAAIALAGAATFLMLRRLSALPPATQTATVIREIKHGVSPPLRTLTDNSTTVWAQADDDEPESAGAEPAPATFVDPVWQRTAGAALVTIPGLNRLGLGKGFRGPSGSHPPLGVPPDPNSAVGDTQIVEIVNLSLAVFDKAKGTVAMGPVFIGNLFETFDASCSNGADMADPVVLYDKQAARWLWDFHTLGTPYVFCVAVSQSSDATGAYNLYAFTQQADGMLTAPKLGTWPDAYYLSTKTTNNSIYYGPLACAMDRTQMLAGQAANMQCIQIDDPNLSGMLPSDMDGPVPPPVGSPNYFMTEGPPKSNALYLYQFHVDFTNPANSILSGPVKIDVAPYNPSFQVPQFGATQKLNTNGDGLLHRLVYRNFADATPSYQALLVTHSVLTGASPSSGVGMRWYELRNPGPATVVYQQGTYAPDSNYRWMGSIAMDGLGDIALGYSISTAGAYPGVRYTGRLASDPLGTMETEATIFDGSGSQSDSDRWGDYTSMSVDPSDDCTIWYTGQYLAAAGSANWATRLFSFYFPACHP
jgi:hypothetical protein